ncbi:L,D-transpeptidase [Streptomyces sp. MMBL 11-3]|uniref:L,D-transpeptidase n=1 Tax=Streptomyces sp. MMBL 11-3 TaxID=3382639 RepID=UPI0039B37204
MSDEPAPGRRPGEPPGGRYGDDAGDAGPVGPELAVALRGLAQDHETPAAVPGAEIRRRAVRRRRRRGAALATAGTAGLGTLALVLAVVLTGGGDTRSVPPAASHGVRTPPPATTVPSPAPVAATVDLVRHELTAGGRTVPVSAGTEGSATPTGLMTVTAKYESAMLPGTVVGWNREYQVKSAWVVRLRGPDDSTGYLLALDWDEKAPGNYDSTGGAIGLRVEDAMWLYKMLTPGSLVRVVGPDPATSAPSTPTGPNPIPTPDPTRPDATGRAAGARDTETGAASTQDTATARPESTATREGGADDRAGADGGSVPR